MSEKNSVQVLIGGKVVRLSGYESEEYLEKVAHYMNHKLDELGTLSGWRRMTQDQKNTLLSLNIADDYFKAKERAENLEDEVTGKDKELMSLKQELASLQVMMENMKKAGQKR
ncbi:MAG: cell division protein ZapA [Clostridiales bacterium]|uniref:cell division protein ZapA n=1 Tax=Chordicoccus furentiruminis TaxID=2709410 RepID=UPI0023A804FB|nr:cell division protein ZapA [Chordicoccus furentiruminis]MCI6173611.1 cell division protein ZapA [Clostridiales bacterium]